MLSTPPARTSSASPRRMARAAWPTASSPDAQSRFTVTPGTESGQAGEEHGHARDVAVVLAGLVGAAEDHLVERAPVHAREALHQRDDRDRREVVGPDGREGASVPAEGRADGGADEGVSHGRRDGRPAGRGGVKPDVSTRGGVDKPRRPECQWRPARHDRRAPKRPPQLVRPGRLERAHRHRGRGGLLPGRARPALPRHEQPGRVHEPRPPAPRRRPGDPRAGRAALLRDRRLGRRAPRPARRAPPREVRFRGRAGLLHPRRGRRQRARRQVRPPGERPAPRVGDHAGPLLPRRELRRDGALRGRAGEPPGRRRATSTSTTCPRPTPTAAPSAPPPTRSAPSGARGTSARRSTRGAPDEVAAVLMEPNAGTNGIVAPDGYWPRLREETRKRGVYLDRRRGDERLRPLRGVVRVAAARRGRPARPDDPRQGPDRRARAPRRGGRCRGRSRPASRTSASRPASPTAGTPSPAPRASPPSRPTRTRASSSGRGPSARGCWPSCGPCRTGCRSSATCAAGTASSRWWSW